MEQKIGYKILKTGRYSALSHPGGYVVKYPKGIEVKPHKGCGPLCVFNNINAARRFKCGLLDRTIVKCTYTPSKEIRVWTLAHKFDFMFLVAMPFGTVLADSVTTLE